MPILNAHADVSLPVQTGPAPSDPWPSRARNRSVGKNTFLSSMAPTMTLRLVIATRLFAALFRLFDAEEPSESLCSG
jgi:hypothetical protein